MKPFSISIYLILFCCDLIRATEKCYFCSTVLDGQQCNDPFRENTTVQLCNNNSSQSFICLKYSHLIGDDLMIVRGCRTSNITCDQIQHSIELEGSKFVACDSCSGDLCNSSTTSLVSFLLLIFCLIYKELRQ